MVIVISLTPLLYVVWIGLGIALVTITLGTSTLRIYQQKLIITSSPMLEHEWIQGTYFNIRDVDVIGDQVTLAIYGSGEQPELSELGETLGASLDQNKKNRAALLTQPCFLFVII